MSENEEHTLRRQPRGTMPKIQALWAWVGIDPVDENEGILAIPFEDTMMPLIAADDERLAQLRPLAINLVRGTGMLIRLVKFSNREEIEEVNPDAV